MSSYAKNMEEEAVYEVVHTPVGDADPGISSAVPSNLPPDPPRRLQISVAPPQVPVVALETAPWWEAYLPPQDASGHLLIDMEAEFKADLRPTSLSNRLQRNGVSEAVLKAALQLMQSADSEMVRLNAAKFLAGYAFGSPGAGEEPGRVSNQILVKIDL
jgi:hypothetical protein